MPAGLCHGDDLVDLLESKGLCRTTWSVRTLSRSSVVRMSGGRRWKMAQLRAAGFMVDYPLKEQGFGKQFKAANQSGARFALIYGSEELENDVVKVRDLASGNEAEIPRQSFLQSVPELMERGPGDCRRTGAELVISMSTARHLLIDSHNVIYATDRLREVLAEGQDRARDLLADGPLDSRCRGCACGADTR